MHIAIDELRDALSKDNLPYVNSKLERLIEEAKASLEPTTGLQYGADVVKDSALDKLTDRYIVEYCRAALDDVDNARMILSLQIQIQAMR